MASHTDLIPVNRAEFAIELTPCLALVGGIGMGAEDRREWLNAAFRALDGIPIALLKRGAAAAMVTADHPSKIIPAIMAEVSRDWDWRRRNATARPLGEIAQAPAEISETERSEVAALMANLVKKLEANS